MRRETVYIHPVIGAVSADFEVEMSDLVKVELDATPEAAELLRDERRRRIAGRFLGRVMVRRARQIDELRQLIAQVKAEAHAAGITDEEIDAEPAAFRAERRA